MQENLRRCRTGRRPAAYEKRSSLVGRGMMLDTARMAFEKGVKNIRREFDFMNELINETQGKCNDIMRGGFDDDMYELLYSMMAASNLARKWMMKMNRLDIPELLIDEYDKLIPAIDEILEFGKTCLGRTEFVL